MTRASEAQLLRCVREIEKGNIAHTLAHCLFWAQHATHVKDGRPHIYKSGSEIAAVLPIRARTANDHLKTLAKRGYWTISYASPPGRVSKVTWLSFSEKAIKLIEMACEVDLRRSRRIKKHTIDGQLGLPSSDGETDHHTSENQTKNQTKSETQTTKKTGFIPTKFSGKQGMKEPSLDFQEKKIKITAPKWKKIKSRTEHLANMIDELLLASGLPRWDWSSQYTWDHLVEIEQKLLKRGIESTDEISEVFSGIFEHWSWLRHCLDNRYASNDLNLHRPTPMALAHECDKLVDKILDKWASESKQATKVSTSNLDEDF